MLQPLRDNIAIAPLGDTSKYKSLFIPETAKQRTDQGIVLFRGEQCKNLRVGDHVFFSPYSGTKVTIDPYGELIFLRELDVFFYDDGKPPEVLLPFAQVMEALDKASGLIKQNADRRTATGIITVNSVHAVTEQLKDILNNRVLSGLEF